MTPREKNALPSTRTTAENLRRYRQRSGRSMRDMAEAMTAAGWPMTHTVISQLENGARRIDVDDLSRFAAVLEVPVVALLVPAREDPAEVVGTSADPGATAEAAVWRIFGPIPDSAAWLEDVMDHASGTAWRSMAAGIESLESALRIFDPIDVDNAALLARGSLAKSMQTWEDRRRATLGEEGTTADGER